MTYAEDRSLREEVYTAFVTRASDAGKFDNSRTMDEILGLRHELALLLGFDNYSEYSLATKMAGTTSEVLDFLNDLARRSKPYAVREYDELCRFAADAFGVIELQAWDVGFYAEKLRQSKYAISQEALRPYFPVPRVIDGLFSIVGRLFGIEIGSVDGVDTWNPGVRVFQVREPSGEHLGLFYLDLYARDHKRGGAWMDECVIRRRSDDTLQHPVAYINCNFTPPIGDEPSLLTHAEVITLFHEFGHGLHHLLTAIDYAAVSGINGVPWDAIELPSQFLENWCWEREAIAALSGHFETGEPLPQELFERLYRAKNFHAAMQMVRQLEFAIFDIRLHSEYRPGSSIQKLLDEVREQVAVVKAPRFNRFQNSFSHIFAGGYAAGYYSYKWAEVLSADAFSRFEEEGIFNPDTGRSFRATVLERGGSEDAATLFESFRGRPPRIDALLRHSGLEA
jgi:oligopeptidase A